ncbi:MAG: lipoyl domain-containing protein [Planctomycetaceae bacterium]|nr:lipoyl domain-containing protein [Planctomycetaceae bacterium]
MTQQRIELRLPDLDLGTTIVTACSWHAAVGARVVEGDRLLEVLAGEVTVDLPAPASGKLIERSVEVDEQLRVGQLLAVIELL